MGEIGSRPLLSVPILLSIIVIAGAIPYFGVISKGYFLGEDFGALFWLRNKPALDFFYVRPRVTPPMFIRPLSFLFWRAESHVFGYNPAFFHMASVALNSISACLLFLIVRGIYESRLPAFFAGLAFAVHPVHAEAVSWLSSCNDLLCAAFFLAAIYFFACYMRKGRSSWYLATILFFILALFSKETGAVLPLVLLSYDLLWGKKAGIKARLKAHLPFFVLAALYLVFRFAVFSGLGGYGETAEVPLSSSVKTFFTGVPYLFLYPVNQEIFQDGSIWVLWLTTGALIALLYIRTGDIMRDYKAPVFSLAFILITFLPVLGILHVNDDLHDSRSFYLPSAGFCILTAWLIAGLFRGRRFFVAKFLAATAAIAVFYGFVLYENNSAWVGASERVKTAFSDLKGLTDKSPKDVVFLVLNPPPLYKGARFLVWGYGGMGIMLSGPDKSIGILPVAKKAGNDGTPGLEDVEFMDLAPQKSGGGLGSAIAAIRKSRGPDYNKALVEWDEGSKRLLVLDKTF